MLGYFLLFVHLIGRKQNDSYVLHGGLYLCIMSCQLEKPYHYETQSLYHVESVGKAVSLATRHEASSNDTAFPTDET
jgi:hypothetical protein